ncbi:MAG: hypothetical protein E6Q97_22345 [Desulfurellales bacterium]|nr:MAG: hypothetical protein E6Q97_22345 [Desulfurellales bacterium]
MSRRAKGIKPLPPTSTEHSVETLRAAIDEHNRAIEATCEGRKDTTCDAWRGRGLLCTECPREYLLGNETIEHYSRTVGQ